MLGRPAADIILPIVWMSKLKVRVGRLFKPDPALHILGFFPPSSVLAEILRTVEEGRALSLPCRDVPWGCLFHLPNPISSVSKGANNSFVGALVGVQQELIVCVLAHSQHTELNVSARPPPSRTPTLANSAAFSTAWQLSR